MHGADGFVHAQPAPHEHAPGADRPDGDGLYAGDAAGQRQDGLQLPAQHLALSDGVLRPPQRAAGRGRTLHASAVEHRLSNTMLTSCRLDSNVLVTARWINTAEYLRLENTTFELFSGRVQSEAPPPNLEKRMCVSTRLMRKDTS